MSKDKTKMLTQTIEKGVNSSRLQHKELVEISASLKKAHSDIKLNELRTSKVPTLVKELEKLKVICNDIKMEITDMEKKASDMVILLKDRYKEPADTLTYEPIAANQLRRELANVMTDTSQELCHEAAYESSIYRLHKGRLDKPKEDSGIASATESVVSSLTLAAENNDQTDEFSENLEHGQRLLCKATNIPLAKNNLSKDDANSDDDNINAVSVSPPRDSVVFANQIEPEDQAFPSNSRELNQ